MNTKKLTFCGGIAAIVLLGMLLIFGRNHSKRSDVDATGGERLSTFLSLVPPRYIQIGEGKQEQKGSAVKGQLELPFLGSVQCVTAEYAVEADRFYAMEQVWKLFWTADGNFVGADFAKPGFAEIPYDKRHLEAVYTARTERIVGLVQSEPQIQLSDLRRIAAEQTAFGDGPNGIQRITIRRVLYTSEIMVPAKEVYIVTVWFKGIPITPSWTGDAVRIVIDSKGNGLFVDNGY